MSYFSFNYELYSPHRIVRLSLRRSLRCSAPLFTKRGGTSAGGRGVSDL